MMKPQLMVEAPKVVDAVQFYKTAFDAIDNSYTLYPKCKAEQELLHILSIQFELIGSTILVSNIASNSASVKSEETGCVLCIKTEDVKVVIAKVVSTRVIVEGSDACCGGHVGKDKAPYGYSWLICSLAKNVADVLTLLGSGSFLLLNSEKSIENRQRKFIPAYLRWPHMQADQVLGLSTRKIGGRFWKHHRSFSVRSTCHAIVKPFTMRYVNTGSDDHLVKIRSMKTAFCLASCCGHEGDVTGYGLPVLVLRGHTGAVIAITFSPRPYLCFPTLIVI
ncbi:uncharacterized protein LOC111283319 [Durio zibethinus]|uniref:Uncharacterized protein LOC111283319 n=1 Tax=Durio zibethinus TaxID=66656 RepID=A0A6P5XGL7_DURZI|nr:uncharacterized protein LOC111283319 [Durio zibethinus]